jgi:hypothetical protein
MLVLGFGSTLQAASSTQAAKSGQAPKQVQANNDLNRAPPADYYHICTNADLENGYWKLVLLKESPKRKEYSFYRHIHYQYLAFLPGNIYSYVATNHEIMKPVDLRKALLWPERTTHKLKYTLDDQGVLNLYLDRKVTYSYRCLAISKDKDEFKKGDLLLKGYTRQSRTELYKLYRRWF